MQLGIFAKTFEGSDPAMVLAAVAQAGYSATQYNMACSGLPALPDMISALHTSAVAAAAYRSNVAIAALSATANLIHPNAAARADGVRRVGVLIAAAPALPTRLVTLCSGTRDAADPWRHHPDNTSPAAWRDLLASMTEVLAFANRYDVDLGIEPEPGNIVRDASAARRLIDDLASPRVKIVLDPANLIEGIAADRQRTVIADAIDRLADRIVMAHAKDRAADGSVVAAGHGVVDFVDFLRRLRAAGFDGPLVTHGLAAEEAAGVAAFLRGAASAAASR